MQQVRINVVARRACPLRAKGESRVAERITKVLEQKKQILAGVVVHRQNLLLPDVEYHKERGVAVGLVRFQRHHVLARVFDQQVVLVQQLQLPHPQIPILIEVLVKLPQCNSVAELVLRLRLTVQINEDPMLEAVDGRLAERAVVVARRNRRVEQKRFLVTAEAADGSQELERALHDLIDVNRLMLDRQHGEGVVVEVKSLIVRQNDFVDAEVQRVGYSSVDEIDDVQRVVFEWATCGLKMDAKELKNHKLEAFSPS